MLFVAQETAHTHIYTHKMQRINSYGKKKDDLKVSVILLLLISLSP